MMNEATEPRIRMNWIKKGLINFNINSDGSIQICIEYRKLNSVTKKNAFPLQRIDEALQTLAHAKYFSTLDLASGYWQEKMVDED